MTEEKPTKKLKCFVISPFGEPNTDMRREADWVLKDMIRPALQDIYDVVRADEFDPGNIITNKMISAIRHADLIVAVLTGHNPNAFYELAVAHAYERPVIPLIETGQKIPFDIGMVGTIVYSRADVDAWNRAKESLKKGADATRVPSYKAENPVTLSLGTEKASASGNTTEQMVATLSAEIVQVKAQMQTLLNNQKTRDLYGSHLFIDTSAVKSGRSYDSGIDFLTNSDNEAVGYLTKSFTRSPGESIVGSWLDPTRPTTTTTTTTTTTPVTPTTTTKKSQK